MKAKDVIRILEAAMEARGGPPEFIRSDNGPEPERSGDSRRQVIARAVQEWIARRGGKTLHIKPGSPWQPTEGR